MRVAAGAGILCRVDDAWAVRCGGCPEAAAAPAPRGKRQGKSARPPSRRKARTGVPRKRATGARKRRVVAAKASAKGRGRSSGRKISGRCALPEAACAIDWSLVYTPIRYDASIALPDGGTAPCTSDYRKIAAEAELAKGARELDLLVALVELRALGHLGGSPGVCAG